MFSECYFVNRMQISSRFAKTLPSIFSPKMVRIAKNVNV